MADAIGTVRGAMITGVAPRATAAVPASGSGATPAAPTEIQPLSPNIHFDPKSGVVITQYFDNEGNVQTQIPSAASVAYRRTSLAHNNNAQNESTVAVNEPPAAVEA